MSDPLSIPCPSCAAPMARVEIFEEQRVRFDLYRCNDPACGRKVVVLFEPGTAFAPEEASLVETEIARRGSFFPSDFAGGQRGRLGRLG